MTWEHRVFREYNGSGTYRAGVIVQRGQSLVEAIAHGGRQPEEYARLMLPGVFSNLPGRRAKEWTRACAAGEARAWRWVQDYDAGGGRRERAMREAGR